MKDVNIFFNKLRISAGAIWLENNKVKLFAPKKFQNQKTKDFVIEHKAQIRSILKENRVFSKEIFLNTIILKNSNIRNYPLSPAQERLWFIEQFEQGTKAYHLPAIYELANDTDSDGIRHALKEIVNRHEVLRSTIEQGYNDQGIQVVHDYPLPIEESTLKQNENIDTFLKEEIDRPFNLASEYPIRVKFFYIGSNRTVLLVIIHHIACDGWSTGIFQRELCAYYEAYVEKNLEFKLPELEVQYRDYAVWQKSYLTGAVLKEQLNYWKCNLKGFQSLSLPTDYPRSKQIDYKGDNYTFSFTKKTSDRLRILAKNFGVTMHSVLLSATNILLGKFSGQEDIVVGSVIANRHFWQTEGLIGFFVNTQVNRTQLNKHQSFNELILEVHQNQLNAQLYQDIPFERLVIELGINRDIFRHQIFQVTFGMQGFGNDLEATEKLKKYLGPYQGTKVFEVEKFDLSIYMNDSEEEITTTISYATSLFHKNSIIRCAGYFTHLIDQLSEFPNNAYSQFSLLDKEGYNQIINQWNKKDRTYTDNETIYELFQKQVQKTPDKTALIYGDMEMSYNQLNEKSNQLARYIRKRYHQRTGNELKPDTLISLCIERGFETVLAILAVLKAGGAYVPIDPSYPKKRISYIMSDTKSELVLVQRELFVNSNVQFIEDKVIYIDMEEDIYDEEDIYNLSPHSTSSDLAYLIYTSGTTGKPNGVMVEHRAVMRLFTTTDLKFGFSSNDIWTLFHSYVFDFSVWELWGALIYGGKLVIISKDQARDIEGFYHLCRKNNVSVLNLTPSAFYRFSDIANQSDRLTKSLRYVILGGEALNMSQLQSWWAFQRKNSLTIKLINMYGITETTVHATYKELTKDEILRSNIGKPLADLKAYVLDNNLSPVPIGVIAELYLGGGGLARGYLNNEVLTNDRFIPNVFASKEDLVKGYDRLYKTGDLVKYLPDGNLEYVCRNDNQVKIRGYRIELDEVEYTLSQISGIKQSCVLAKERQTDSDITRYLVGYFVLDSDNMVLDKASIKQQLLKLLPEYMVPPVLFKMESFPLTFNGKLDRRSLLNLEEDFPEQDYIPPSTQSERTMCNIWQEVLNIEKVGITDDFFKIGGDSILSIRLVSKSKELGFKINVIDIFKYRHIQDILRQLDKNVIKEDIEYSPFSIISNELKTKLLEENKLQVELIKDIYPASYLQSGMLIESLIKSNDVYHDVFSYSINAQFDRTKFEEIWHGLITKNELLRSSFIQTADGYFNIVYSSIPINSKIQIINQSYSLEKVVNTEKNISFDLASPGLFKLLIRTNPNDENFTLIFSFHHSISDGWSVASLVSEFVDIYVHNELMEMNVIPSYGKFVSKELKALKNDIQKQFWLDYLSDYELKSINHTVENKTISNDKIAVGQVLDSDLNDRILNLSKYLKLPPDIIFLGIYNLVLKMIYNTNDLVIGTVVNNRLEEEGGDRLFGLHLNTVPIRFQRYENKYKTVKDYLITIFNNKLELHQFIAYPYGKMKSDLNLQEDIYHCAFNYIHFHISEKNYEKQSFETDFSHEKTNIPMALNVLRYKDTFNLGFEGFNSFIDTEGLEMISRCMMSCLDHFTNNPNGFLKDVHFLNNEEYNKIVYEWNSTDHNYPKEKTIHQLFQEQVEKTPYKIALICDEYQLTYQELNEKSNQLARYIRYQYEQRTQQSFTPETLIVLYLERSFEMIIGILAVLKAGGTYVPIDTVYPKERIDYILEETQARLILCRNHLDQYSQVQLSKDKVVCINFKEEFYKHEIKSNLHEFNKATDLAYVIYTSGTTGKPNGVMVEHKSISSKSDFYKYQYGVNHKQISLFYRSFGFDGSIEEYLIPLLHGAKIVIYTSRIFDLLLFTNIIKENHVTKINMPPQLLYKVINLDKALFKNIKILVSGGDKLNFSILHRYNLNCDIYNSYGPTECTIDTHIYKIMTHDTFSSVNRSIIGKSVFDCKSYILDQNNHPVPIGVIGELYIGGAGLARGYLNNKALTKDRFITNPFATEDDKAKGYIRLYRTGDLARLLPDSNIEFIGRKDNQVKIRGYRIELGEIEHTLSEIEGVEQGCVLVKERQTTSENNKYLIGYYVLSDGNTDVYFKDKIITSLCKVLPKYMIPNILVELESLPLTVNGKLDKRALPEPEFDSLGEDYCAPTSEIEITICKIWQKVLELKFEDISVTKSFFELGGHSLNATEMVYHINKELDSKVSLVDVFTYPTIKELAIKAKTKNENIVFEDNGMVILKEVAKESKNLFWIHDGSGDIQAYIKLTNLIQNYNSYGIRSATLCYLGPRNIETHNLATEYIKQIKEIQPLGPYNIGGWSIGGALAFEITRQLEFEGEMVEILIMIDTVSSSENFNVNQQFTLDSEKLFVAKLLKIKQNIVLNSDTIENLWEEVVHVLNRQKNSLDIVKKAIPQNLRWLIPNFNSLSLNQLLLCFNTIRTLNNINFQYHNNIILKTQLLYLKAKETNYNINELSKYFEKDVFFEEIYGNHFSIMNEPNNKVVAKAINLNIMNIK